MTFAKAIKILDLLDHDKEIEVQKDNFEYLDDEPLRFVDRITKDSEISDCLEYFTDSKYHFFEVDCDSCTGEEI